MKNATEAGAGRFGKPAPDARAAPPEAHESLISRKTGAEVPLTGLSLARRYRGLAAIDAQVLHATCIAPASRHTSIVTAAQAADMIRMLSNGGPAG